METTVVYELEDHEELQNLYQTHWWFEDRDLERIRRSLEHTDEFIGLRNVESERLIGSARVITDYVYTGKILDVIVDGSLRRQGVGKQLMEAITDHPRLNDIEKLTLNCREGVALFYETCGFHVHDMIKEADRGNGEDYYVMVYE